MNPINTKDAGAQLFSGQQTDGDLSDKYDVFYFRETVLHLANPYRVALYYGLTLAQVETLNKQIDDTWSASSLSCGDKIYLPKGAMNGKRNVAGDLDATGKKIYIAWTWDDGPKGDVTRRSYNAMYPTNKVTYYIQYDLFPGALHHDNPSQMTKAEKDGQKKWLDFYRNVQRNGGEIAIHGLHKTKNHLSYFPYHGKSPDKYYSNIQDATDDLKDFLDFLTDNGLRVKFVRPPYGLYSEIYGYLRKKGYAGGSGKDADKLARSIIKGQSVSGTGALAVKADFDHFTNKLDQYGLHIGMDDGGAKIGTLDWDSETSGTSLTDNLTYIPGSTDGSAGAGKFEGWVRSIYNTPKTAYMIVLGHDTLADNIVEFKRDRRQVEYYASYYGLIKKKTHTGDKYIDVRCSSYPNETDGVQLEYITMSEMYKLKFGVDP